MKKRILSLILAFAMAATLAPATALVGSSTAKAVGAATGQGYLVKLNETNDIEAPTKEVSSISLKAAQGTELEFVLVNDQTYTGVANDVIKLTPMAGSTTQANNFGISPITFTATQVDGNAATSQGDFAAFVSDATLDIPKNTAVGNYTLEYFFNSDGNAAARDINSNGNVSDDIFTINIEVTAPTSDWAELELKETNNAGRAIGNDSVLSLDAGDKVNIYVKQDFTSKYDDYKSTANPFTDNDDLKTEIKAAKTSEDGWINTGAVNGSNGNNDPSIEVPAGTAPGVYRFKAVQSIGSTVVRTINFGVRVGGGATVTLDPKGGEIYDAAFAKDGSKYVGDFPKNYEFTGTDMLPTPVKADELFAGWSAEGTTTVIDSAAYAAGVNIGTGKSYYANWTKKVGSISLISGVPGIADKSTPVSTSLNDQIATQTNVFNRKGWKLLGWSTRPDTTYAMYETTARITVDMVKSINAANKNLALYAVWAPKTITINFDPGIPGGEKLSPYSATSKESITWKTNERMDPTDWMKISAHKFHINGYQFVGWSRDLGGGTSSNAISKVVYNELNGKEYAGTGDSYGVIDLADLQTDGDINITLYAAWDNSKASFITLKETTGNELDRIIAVDSEAPDRAGRTGYLVKEWVSGTDKWTPKGDTSSVDEVTYTTALTPVFKEEPIKYNMIVAETNINDYALVSAGTTSIGEIQGDAGIETFTVKDTPKLFDRKTSGDAATFVGYEAWVSRVSNGVSKTTARSIVSNNRRTSANPTGWVKLDGIFKGTFSALDMAKKIDEICVDGNYNWNDDTCTGTVFFYPVWKYNLSDAKLMSSPGNPVNSLNLVVNYGTSLSTVQNKLMANGVAFYVKDAGRETLISVPNVNAGVTLTGSYNPIKAGTYNLKATIYPRDNTITYSASFTRDVVVRVLSKTDSGFAEEAVVATGFTALPEINLPIGSNVEDVLAALSKYYRVEASADNGSKYSLEAAEVNNSRAGVPEWQWKATTTNYGGNIVNLSDEENSNFDDAYSTNGAFDEDMTFKFALAVNENMLTATEYAAITSGTYVATDKQAGNLSYIGLDITAAGKPGATRTDMNGNKYIVVYVNVGDGSKPTPVTPAEPEKDETDPERPEMKAGPVYRLYNPHNGDHLFTTSKGERNILAAVGWQVDAVTFNTPSSADQNAKPVYRVYNPNSGEHFYTMSKGERNSVVNSGWKYEGVEFYAYSTKSSYGVPVYRLWSPASTDAGSHHITGSKGEYNALGKIGWKQEGVAFRAVKADKAN